MKAFGAQVAADDQTARAGFVNKAQLDVGLRQTLDEFVHGLESAANDAVAAHLSAVLWRDGHGDGLERLGKPRKEFTAG